MNQLPNAIQTSEEIITQAKLWFKEFAEENKYEPAFTNQFEPFFIIGCLRQSYDTLLKSISEDTRDKFIASSDAPTYEEMAVEEHDDFIITEDDLFFGDVPEPNSQVHPLFKDIINNSFKI